MAFCVKKKKVKGHYYYYLVLKRREFIPGRLTGPRTGRLKEKHIAYLGKQEPSMEQIIKIVTHQRGQEIPLWLLENICPANIKG